MLDIKFIRNNSDLIKQAIVAKNENARLHRLLVDFEKLTGLPVLLNTSYNLRGFPIATTTRQILQTFFSSGIDAILFDNILLEKDRIKPPYPADLIISPLDD